MPLFLHYNEAINKVAFNFPAGTSNIDLQVNMPKSSVTIKPASGSLGINELISKTAKSTLIIESGVTVNCLHFKPWKNEGYAVVKNGAKVNGIACAWLEAYPNGIKSWYLVKDSVHTTTGYTDDDLYMVQNGKLLAQENGYPSSLNIIGTETKASADSVEITIPDGVKAWIGESCWTASYDDANWPIVNVTGEGDATFMYEGVENDGKVELWNNGISLNRINKLTNVTVDFTHALVYNSEDNKYEALEVDTASNTYKNTSITLPINSEDCTFNAKHFSIANNLADGIVSSTHKNCIFNSLKNDRDETFNVPFPEQNDKRKSFTLAFDTCEFDQAKFSSWFRNFDWETFKDYKGYISFANSKIGGKAVSKTTDMIAWAWPWTDGETVKAETFFTIDGVNYKPIEKDNKWYLLEVE